MKKTLCAVMLAVAVLAGGGAAQTAGWISSYWDGCKPTCSWFQNLAPESRYGLSTACDINNNELFLGDIAEAPCAKDGGPAYTCWNQVPFVDPGNPLVAYGFGATASAKCGQCFEVSFTGEYENGAPMPMHTALSSGSSGKKLIIMGRNTGGVGSNQIDFLVPGGGLGDFDCFTPQLGPGSSSLMGQRFGGLLRDCIDGAIAQFAGNWNAPGVLEWVQNCHRTSCETSFGGDPKFAQLLEGCKFHSDWMMSAPNPKATVRVLDECPQILVDGYKPQSAKYTLMTKAMNFTSNTGNPNINPGNQTISSINSQITLTYNNINTLYAGSYTLSFAVATRENTSISVSVNGTPAGTISNITTSDWGVFEKVTLDSPIELREGDNTVVLSFQTNSLNFDYFVFVGDEDVIRRATGSSSSVRPNPARPEPTRSARPNVTFRPAAGGFTATLPTDHAYTSYTLINLQGREIGRGNIGAGTTDIRINNINAGVVFLKLNGRNGASTTVRTATAR